MTKHKALAVLHGGPLDGKLTSVSSHDELVIEDDGYTYERQDQQEGDYRVYRYDGSPLPVETRNGPDPENRLAADLAQLDDEQKAAKKK